MLSEQQQRIMGYFIEEAKDHLNTIEQGLLNLQGTIEDPELVSEVFRAAHSVKGGAAMLGLESIQKTAHRLEDFFKVLKECPLKVDRKTENLLFNIFDALKELLEQLQGPYGLTDDKAAEVMAGVEPIFETVGQHLNELVSQSGGIPPEEVQLSYGKPADTAPVYAAASAAKAQTEEASALQLIFQSDVPARLRDMLQLFKQGETEVTRQQLQDICNNLAQAGDQLDLPAWTNLLHLSRRAIACPDNSYRALAPVVIKEIKQAQELVLSGQATIISCSEGLMGLVPPEEESIDTGNFEELLATIDVEDDESVELLDFDLETSSEGMDGQLSDWSLDTDPFDPEPNLFDEAMPSQPLSSSGEFDLGFGGMSADLDAGFSLNSSVGNDFAASLDHQGPEVGAAELNSLADLFEGEVPDLGTTWQEEEVLPDADVIEADAADSATDFSDLLFDQDGLDDLSLEEDLESDDLSELLKNTEQADSLDTDEVSAAPIDSDGSFEEDSEEDWSFDALELPEVDADDIEVSDEADSLTALFSDLAEDEGMEASLQTLPEQDFSGDLFGDAASDSDPFGESLFGESTADEPGEVADDLFGESAQSDDLTPDLFGDSAPLTVEEPSLSADLGDMQMDEELGDEGFDLSEFAALEETDDRLDSSEIESLFGDAAAEEAVDSSFDLRAGLTDPWDFDAATSTDAIAVTLPEEEQNEVVDLWGDLDEPSDIASSLSEEAIAASASSSATELTDLDHLFAHSPDDEAIQLSATEAITDLDEETVDAFQEEVAFDLSDDLGSLFGGDAEASESVDENLTDFPVTEDDNSDSGFGSDFDLSGLFGEESPAEVIQPWMSDTASPVVDLEEMAFESSESLDALFDLEEGNAVEENAAEESLFGADSFAEQPETLDDVTADPFTTDVSLDDFDFNLEAESSEPDLSLDLALEEPAEIFPTTAPASGAVDLGFDDFADLSGASFDELALMDLEATAVTSTDLDLDAALDALDFGEEATVDVGAAIAPEVAIDNDFDLDALLAEDDLDDASIPEITETTGVDDLSDLDALLDEVDSEAGMEEAAPAIALAADDFADLEALLSENDAAPTQSAAVTHHIAIEPSLDDDFADLEALLDEPISSISEGESEEPEEDSKSGAFSEFDDLEKLLEDADQTLGGPPTSRSSRGPALSSNRRSSRRGSGVLTDQTMRVSVKNLDNLNNLVGELVVNRNSLEQAQERLRQFLDNLLYQVQQLSDVGQRMRDLYERSLLESSLLSSRKTYHSNTTGASGGGVQTSHATGMSFDALEMDRFTGFHTLSQEMIELIVRVRESASDIDFVVDETDQVTRNFRQITTQLQEGLTRSRMVPFAQTADRLPRAVRDISLKCGKQAELVVEGRETLIDKMILEQLYDPMTHLVNNAITHGIESPEERAAAGKAPIGRITVRTFHQGNQTVIAVTDDGAGIDPDNVKRKAVEKGLVTPAQAKEMTRLDIYDLLFHHGFSTRDKADDFAGRGVGMDVVRTSLNEIRGVINIDSAIGRGTTFTIRLPLTLSISKALCCISNRARIAFPMDGVEDMLDVPKERILRDDQDRPCIQWRDSLLPFYPLSELLRYNRSLGRGSVYGGNQEEDIVSVVVLRSAGNFLALQVDQVLGEQEIVIKQLEGPVPKPIGVAGATVLGDGRIMPIADVLELIDLSMGRIRRDVGSSLWEKDQEQPPTDVLDTKTEPTVLIVDDSITVRELLSMTFAKVGYRVEQARDGQEAWEKLRSGLPCDLVFCDIEMPRMDGLELLSRIQKDGSLNHLPIAMLTSRGADRHRQMAIQLGAKGYFTKPYLEEALLDAAQRMLNGEVLVGSGSGG